MNQDVNVDHVTMSLRELAYPHERERLWLSTGGSSLTECVCRLFDDSGLGDALEKGVELSDSTDEKIRRLSKVLKRMNEDRTPQEILADPAIEDAETLARAILGELLGTSHA